MRLYKFVPVAGLFVLGALFTGAPSAFAQYHFGYSTPRSVEISGFAGGTFNGSIQLPNSFTYDYLRIDHNYDYGVRGDVDLFGSVQAEFTWSRQPTTLEQHNFINGVISPFSNVNVDSYQWSLVYQFGDSSRKLRPYLGGGIGFTHWGVPSGVTLPFSNTVGFNLGGGVKYFLAKHYGVRLGFRWLPSRTTSQLGQFCDPYYGCYTANVNNYAQQIQLNGGLIFRF
jgi:opacity protein-like surface antigen